VERVRADFPILTREVNGSPLVYLDSAATSQKPTPVLDRLDAFYRLHNANVHRGVHVLAEEATEAYESARRTLAAFLNVADPAEVVFTKGSTEAINLVAYALSNAAAARPGSPYSEYSVGPGDEICITEMEHHSNIVPWQLLCERTGATLRWLPITDAGRLDLTDLETLVNERTRLLAFVHQSNILGTVNSVSPLVERARTVGALTLLDASQSVPHRGIDVQALGVDLAVLTGHKMCGPTGVGALWGRREVLEALPPVQGGGEMITTVSMAGSTYAPLPHKFEAGTPPIAQAVGLAAACDYLSGIGMDAIREHERDLTSYTLDRLAEVAGVRVIGPSTSISRGGAVSFTLDGIHPHDVGQLLDARGIAVRVGHHCAKPVCDRFGVAAVTRASSYLYTTRGEIDALVDGIEHVRRFFA
jgi:cysteine desulfurase/selenocysteine lyase